MGLFEVLEGLKLSQASTRLEARGLGGFNGILVLSWTILAQVVKS